MIQNQEIRQWLQKSWGEREGNRMFNMLVEDGGGVHVFFEGVKYPCKGFNYNDTVETVDEVKKTSMGMMRGFFEGLRNSPVKMMLFSLLFRKQFVIISQNMLRELDYRLARVRQKPDMYCRSGREIYRTFNKMIVWYPEWKDYLERMRNIVCMVWEYDDAYRYPGQDVFEEFDRENAKKNIVGELMRLLKVYTERDFRGTSLKFERISRLLWFLRLRPKIKKAIQRFFLELNIEEIKLDESDNYHSQYKWGYDWRAGKAYKRFQVENPDAEPIEDMEKNRQRA